MWSMIYEMKSNRSRFFQNKKSRLDKSCEKKELIIQDLSLIWQYVLYYRDFHHERVELSLDLSGLSECAPGHRHFQNYSSYIHH